MPNYVRQGGRFSASAFGSWSTTTASGSVSGSNKVLTLSSSPVVSAADGTPFTPFSTGASLTIGFGLANAETVTPSVVDYVSVPGAVNVTVTISNAHNSGEPVVSGTAGLQEAVNYAAFNGGGTVEIDGTYTGTAAQIAAVVANALVTLEDTRTGINARNSGVNLAANGAIPVASGVYVITKGSAAAMTLAAPVAGIDDGKVIVVVAKTAFAHTVTAPANKINDTLSTCTFAAAKGNNAELVASGGVWYLILPSTGVTLT